MMGMMNQMMTKKIIRKMSINEREALANKMRTYVEKELSIDKFINQHEISNG